MPVPATLPDRFTARLAGRVQALVAHTILTGDRALVAAGDEAPLEITVRVDREAGTLRLVHFPDVSDRVGTAIGEVSATVSVADGAEGSYDAGSGHAALAVRLTFEPKHLLARTSRVGLELTTDGRLGQPELAAEGDPLDEGDDKVVLVGEGTFEGGSLDGGTLWLAVTCAVEAVEEA